MPKQPVVAVILLLLSLSGCQSAPPVRQPVERPAVSKPVQAPAPANSTRILWGGQQKSPYLDPADYPEDIYQQTIVAEKERQRQLKIAAAAEAERQRRQREAAAVAEKKRRRIRLTGEFVTIPGGSFQMGSNDGDSDEQPVHRVRIGGFKMGKYEVTQSQWQAVMGSNPSRFKGANRPVENVSWDDVQEYIGKLNRQTGGHFRLPSEAEWEYAARAGSTTEYSWGDNIGHNRANCRSCGSRWSGESTAPVGSFQANGFGLYDMHGNVYEWVQDRLHDSYRGAPTDGSAWESGDDSRRVLRGGSWLNYPGNLRSANRGWNGPDVRGYNNGFRLVQDL